MKKSNQFLSCLIISLLLISCQREEIKNADQSIENEELTNFLVSTGFRKEDIQFDALKNKFILQKDMLLSKDEVKKYLTRSTQTPSSVNGRTLQRAWLYQVSSAYIHDIKVFVDSSVPSSWYPAITNVVASQAYSYNGIWAQVNPHRLRIYSVSTAAAADVVISAYNDPSSSVMGQATLPSADGRPGSSVTLNTSSVNNLTSSRMAYVVAHNFGHILGLWNTDGTDVGLPYIAGTPTFDPNSVMNEAIPSSWNGSFSAGDWEALQMEWPVSTSGWLMDTNTGADPFSSYFVNWDRFVNNPSSVKIELYQNGNFLRVLNSHAVGIASDNWAYAVVDPIEAGTGYNIKITSNDNPNIFDFMDTNFDSYGSGDRVTTKTH